MPTKLLLDKKTKKVCHQIRSSLRNEILNSFLLFILMEMGNSCFFFLSWERGLHNIPLDYIMRRSWKLIISDRIWCLSCNNLLCVWQTNCVLHIKLLISMKNMREKGREVREEICREKKKNRSVAGQVRHMQIHRERTLHIALVSCITRSRMFLTFYICSRGSVSPS
jgi:hypothetical protein